MSNATLNHLPAAVRNVIRRARGELSEPQKRVPRGDRPKCGARTRKGTLCRCQAIWDDEKNAPRNGRCKFHGGASTGPKTPEGLMVSRRNLAKATLAAQHRAQKELAQ